MAYPNGYQGELNRFAGDASEQRAKDFAQKHGHAQVVFHPDFKVRGVSNCFVVLDYDAPKPEGAHVVALFEGKVA
ncbi:MAG: hypothetical protein QOD00_1687 [Blastocatellia bacterium]|jgi:hypothetical protein|nr:hypothetical protein [Blastocatellia bacterium]